MELDERNNLTELFDIYGALLSDKQREVLGTVLNQDIGESELAELFGESRQSVHDAIFKARAQLKTFEDKCKILAEKKSQKAAYNSILKHLNNNEPLLAKEEIKRLINKN